MLNQAASVRDEFQSFLLRMAGKYQPFPELREREADLRLLADSLSKPFTLAVFGRMKTGKSSLINALVGRPLAITGVEEATATLNWISYGDKSQEDTVLVHWKDGRVEPISFSRLLEWTGKQPEVLARVRNTSFIQLFANASRLKEVQIVDTPGTGSVADEHEELAQDLLSQRASEDTAEEGHKADALLYVFSPVAREKDAAALAEFQKTRLPGSDPYNSIGVLHKWDGLEYDDLVAAAKHKADRLHDVLKDVVSTVITVSAPLALTARHAPDSYFTGLLEVLSSSRDKMRPALKTYSRWDDDPARKAARAAYPSACLPWVCFVRLVNLLLDRSCESVAEARAASLEASGIERLEAELDRRFFRRAAVIKQRLTRVKAKESITKGLMFFNERIELLAAESRHFTDLAARISTGDPHREWLREKTAATKKEHFELECYAVDADRDWLVEEERMNLMEKDLAFLEQMDKTPGFIEPRDHESIERLLTAYDQPDNDEQLPKEVLMAMISRYQHEMQGPVKRTRELFEHLILTRIQERLLKA
ncbi:MAG: dynamin family protein [Verrucomicrobiota bacterium]